MKKTIFRRGRLKNFMSSFKSVDKVVQSELPEQTNTYFGSNF